MRKIIFMGNDITNKLPRFGPDYGRAGDTLYQLINTASPIQTNEIAKLNKRIDQLTKALEECNCLMEAEKACNRHMKNNMDKKDSRIATVETANRVLRFTVDDLERRLQVTDFLLSERQQLLDVIPECEMHGKCVPHALKWIEKAKTLPTMTRCSYK